MKEILNIKKLLFFFITLITFINVGYDNEFINRFLKAWSISLPVAMLATLIMAPVAQNIVNKITS